MPPSSCTPAAFRGPYNWYYILTIIVIGCGSIPKGYDEGGFSAAVSLRSFKDDFYLSAGKWVDNPSGLASRKANITSFGVLGAAIGSLIASALTDRIGRLRCWQMLALLYMSGYVMQIFSTGIYGFLLFARIWGGLGAGGLTVVGPLYLSEIAPAKSRGMIVSVSMVFLLTFLSLGLWPSHPAPTRGLFSPTLIFLPQGSSSTMLPVSLCRTTVRSTGLSSPSPSSPLE